VPNFSSYVKKLRENPSLNHVQAWSDWVVVRDQLHSNNKDISYFAIKNSDGGISTAKATIKLAYLIKQNGYIDTKKRWAAKILTGQPNDTIPSANSEALMLKGVNDEVARATMTGKQQVILSRFHNGKALCDDRLQLSKGVVTDLNLSNRLKLIAQIAKKYHSMHNQGIIHRDTKGSNIIINKDEVKATVIDFGSAIKLKQNELARVNCLDGMSVEALAPEVFADKRDIVSENIRIKDNCGYVCTKTDIYALAPVFRGILGQNNPYKLNSSKIFKGKKHVSRQELINHQDKTWPEHMVAFTEEFKNNNLSIPPLAFKLPANNKACAFLNKKTDLAPCDTYILANVVADPNKPCYIL
jgi:serine/threonine protein kinase